MIIEPEQQNAKASLDEVKSEISSGSNGDEPLQPEQKLPVGNDLIDRELTALFASMKKSLERQESKKRLQSVAESMSATRTTLSTILLIAVSVILIVIVCLEVRRPGVEITGFDAPVDFEKAGYSSNVIASRLADHISTIYATAKSRAKRLRFTPSSYESLPDLEVPQANLSLRSVVQYAKYLLGYVPTRVNGEIIDTGGGLQITVRIIRADQQQIKSRTIGPTRDLDQLLSGAAEYVIAENEPYILASYLYETGRIEAALDQAKFCVYNGTVDDDAWAYVLWGLILEEQNQQQKAMEKFKKAIELDPNFSLAYINLGRVLEGQKDYTAAIEHYKKAIEIEPEAALAYNNWGNILLMQDQYEEAIKKFQAAIRYEPDLTLPYKNWGEALLKKKAFQEAVELYDRAIDANPKAVDLYLARGNAFERENKFDDAVVNYKKAIELNPLYSPAYNAWGWVHQQRGEMRAALSQYQKAVEVDPNNALAYNNWGYALQVLRDFKGAKSKLEKAIQLKPDYGSAINNLGYCLENLRKYREAEDNYIKASKLEPQNPLPIFNLAYLLEAQKRYAEAVVSYEKVLALQSEGELARYADSARAKLREALNTKV